MFIKLTAICVAFVPLIICRQESENPEQSVARAANFFGCLSASKHRASSHRIKAVNRVLGLSLGPLKVSAELHRYFGVQKHPFDRFPEESNAFPGVDGGVPEIFGDAQEPSSSPQPTDTVIVSANDAVLEATTETTQAPLNSSKLKDFAEVTFDDGVRGNRVRRESSTDESSSEAAAEVAAVTDSTTIDSSTIQAEESSLDSIVSLSPPLQPNYQPPHVSPSFPYPPSRNPSAQYVSIAQSPHYYPPIKSYYDFHPSQPDFIPYCINWFQNTFAPIVHDTWPTSDYRKWK